MTQKSVIIKPTSLSKNIDFGKSLTGDYLIQGLKSTDAVTVDLSKVALKKGQVTTSEIWNYDGRLVISIENVATGESLAAVGIDNAFTAGNLQKITFNDPNGLLGQGQGQVVINVGTRAPGEKNYVLGYWLDAYRSVVSDTLTGTSGDDVIFGAGGSDSLVGGAGNDTLYGGMGLDTLTGGAGNDVFAFGSLGDFRSSGALYPKIIADFGNTAGNTDVIDLRVLGKFYGLHYNATATLSTWGKYDVIFVLSTSGTDSFIKVNLNNDKASEISIQLTGVTHFDPSQLLLS